MSPVPFGQVPTESHWPVAPPVCSAAVAECLPLPDTPGRRETPDACPPLISDRTARNGLSVRPVRTSRPTWAVDLKSNDQSRPPWKPSGSPTSFENPLGNPSGSPSEVSPEDPLGNLSKTLSEILSKTPSGRATPKHPPFGALRSVPRVPRPLRSRPKALPNAPFEAFAGTSFRTFRRRPRVLEASRKPFRNPSELPSEHDTCPRVPKPEANPGSPE